MSDKYYKILSVVLLTIFLGGVLYYTTTQGADKSARQTAVEKARLATASSITNSKDDGDCKFEPVQGVAKVSQPDPEKIKLLKIEDTQIGTGREVKAGDFICINYKGTLEDGTEFDSSYKRNKPFTTQIGVSQVIPGWDNGIVGLKEGGKRKLTIPPELGYGSRATGSIPADSTLIFEVELVKIK